MRSSCKNVILRKFCLFTTALILCGLFYYVRYTGNYTSIKTSATDTDFNTSHVFKERQSSIPVKPAIVKVYGTKAYLLSAVSESILDENNIQGVKRVTNDIVVTGWYAPGNSKSRYGPLTCCFYHGNGRLSSSPAERRKRFNEVGSDMFDVLQCACPIQASNKVPVSKVSIVEVEDVCTYNTSYYIDVEGIPKRKINGIALCAKVMYGSLDAAYLIEWFEAYRLLGISKIFCYIHRDLNKEAKTVVNYYQKKKFAKAVPFDIPENDTYPRTLWVKNHRAWTDQGVSILDCQERMSVYKYATYLDTDEILIPEYMELKNSLNRYIPAMFESSERLAGVHFKTVVHMKSWGDTDPAHPLFIGRHVNSTLPMWDRRKFAFKPDRIIPASCTAHDCHAKPGYLSERLTDERAIIHHFRSCRREWERAAATETITEEERNLFVSQPNGTFCSTFKRHRSQVTEHLAEEIKDAVLKELIIEGMSSITTEHWSSCEEHVKKIEYKKYWETDIARDKMPEPVVISIDGRL